MIVDIYDMIFDNPNRQSSAKFLGRFRKVETIVEDMYSDLFIAQNVETGTLCLIKGREVCGYGGGEAFEVYPLKNVCVLPNMEENANG